MHNRMLLFISVLLKHGRHFDYWNQPLNMHMRVCYLDCYEAGLCCYLVMHRKPITSITAVLFPFMTYLLTPLVYIGLTGHLFPPQIYSEIIIRMLDVRFTRWRLSNTRCSGL
jgi:hypothetical protein